MAPRLGGELPPVKPVRKRPVQVVSNMAAPYGSNPVKDGTIYPRNPIPGRNNPRRPTR